jgi:hypothetical protein
MWALRATAAKAVADRLHREDGSGLTHTTIEG